MNLLREKIGIMIREKRNSQHLTQEELAEKVNLSTGMIGQIERGETMPSIESLDAIIKELGHGTDRLRSFSPTETLWVPCLTEMVFDHPDTILQMTTS